MYDNSVIINSLDTQLRPIVIIFSEICSCKLSASTKNKLKLNN